MVTLEVMESKHHFNLLPSQYPHRQGRPLLWSELGYLSYGVVRGKCRGVIGKCRTVPCTCREYAPMAFQAKQMVAVIDSTERDA